MTPALIDAAVRLADTLARENQALAALDLARAAGMLSDKQRAAEAYYAAQTGSLQGAATEQSATVRDVAARLGALAEENRRLLERAVAVQSRIVGLLASAVRPKAIGYGVRDGRASGSRPEAIAIFARA